MRIMQLKNRGDTIVEVLVAIAISGGIIAGGYSIATRSLSGVQVSNERSQVTKLAEAQIEILQTKLEAVKSRDSAMQYMVGPTYAMGIPFAVSSGSAPADSPLTQIAYCFTAAGNIVRMESLPGDSLDSTDAYPTECTTGPSAIYHVAITAEFEPTAPHDISFLVEVRWDRLGGGKEKLGMVYRASVIF